VCVCVCDKQQDDEESQISKSNLTLRYSQVIPLVLHLPWESMAHLKGISATQMHTATRTHVIFLHGYGQCAALLARKTAALARVLSRHARVTFLDAPVTLPPTPPSPSLLEEHASDAPDTRLDPATPPVLESRAWFSLSRDTISSIVPYEGFETAVAHVRQCMQDDVHAAGGAPTRTVVIGFSQGATLAVFLAALNLVDAAVAVAPYPVKDPGASARMAAAFARNAPQAPVLAFAGKRDTLVPPCETQTAIAAFRSRGTGDLVLHEAGHVFPSDASTRKTIASFVLGEGR
jgi:predicted esterase